VQYKLIAIKHFFKKIRHSHSRGVPFVSCLIGYVVPNTNQFTTSLYKKRTITELLCLMIVLWFFISYIFGHLYSN
jgi:hypothetical protein